ncbi:MAG TPA: hypothetical protein VGT05_00220 [Patescibacteria group bacterium]|nr:hypothetical protein [Patescibacteria group bacterium]
MRQNSVLHMVVVLFLVLVSMPLILPYIHSGYFLTHDGLWAVVRLGDMFRELRDHQFPARYSGNLDFGYGYPLFNFAYPFPYYFGILFHLAKIPFVTTIKILFGLTVPLSAVFMYFASCALWKNKLGGVVSALLYIYLPYRMVDLYVRGSIGESFAFVCFPLLVLAIRNIAFEKQKNLWIGIGGLAFAILITSHNIMALLFLPVLLGIGIVCFVQNRQAFIPLLVSFFLGLFLAAFFWIPALLEKNLILLSKISIANRSINFVSLPQLLFSSWNYGNPGSQNGFTYQIGFAQLFGFLLALVLAGKSFITKEKDVFRLLLAVFFIVLVFLMISMLFSWSNFLWQHMPLFSIIDYPWTFLGPIGFVLSLLGGYAIGKHTEIMTAMLVLVVIFQGIVVFSYAKPETYIFQPDNWYLTNQATTTSSSEYTPVWVKQLPLQSPLQKVVVQEGSVTNHFWNSREIAFSLNLPKNESVKINTIYYPGWKFFVDATPVGISYANPQGVMYIQVPRGQHVIKGVFRETPLRLSADIISLIGICIVIGLFFFSAMKQFQT